MHTVTVSWLLHTYLTFQLFIGSFSASVSSFIHQVCFHFTFSWCTNFPTSLKSKNLFAIVYFVDFHIFLMCIKSSEWKSIEWSVVCQVCEVNVGVWPPVAASSLLCSVWICEDSAAPSQTDDLPIKIKNTSFVSFQVTKSSVCVKILPFPRVRTSTSSLPDEEKLKPVTKQKRRLSGHIHYLFIVQITVLKQLTLKLTAGSEGRQDGCCDQLLHRGLHPPLSIDHPGSLRQTATELVVPP